MAAAAVTIRNCFGNPLPLYINPHAGQPIASVSGDSTASTDAPRFSKSLPVGHWTRLATTFLNSLPPAALTNEYVYNFEEAIHHGSEDDVVRAAALYLLHPVNQALCIQP